MKERYDQDQPGFMTRGSRGEILQSMHGPYVVEVVPIDGKEDEKYTTVVRRYIGDYVVGSCVVGKKIIRQEGEYFVREGEIWSVPRLHGGTYEADWRAKFQTSEDLLELAIIFYLPIEVNDEEPTQQELTYGYTRKVVGADWVIDPKVSNDGELADTFLLPNSIPSCYTDTGVNVITASILPYEIMVSTAVSWREMIDKVFWRPIQGA